MIVEEDRHRPDPSASDPWALALDSRRARAPEPSSFTAGTIIVSIALGAAYLWFHLVFLLRPLPYFSAYAQTHDVGSLPGAISFGLALPYLIAPLPSILLMVFLGALFPGRWWQTGPVAALVQVLWSIAFSWLVLSGVPASSRIHWDFIYGLLGAPFVLYPLATFAGYRWIQSCTPKSRFWIGYAVITAGVCVAMGVYSAFAYDIAAYTRYAASMSHIPR